MDKKTRIRHIIYYLLITFLLPIPFLIGVKFTHNEIIKTILYGIEIASPSIAAFTMLIIERRFKEFFKEGFRKDKLLVSLLLPIGLVIVTSFLAKLLSLIFCHDLKLFGELTGIQVLIIIYTLIAEEFGWRGYIEPYLEKILKNKILVPVIVGSLWALSRYHTFIVHGIEEPLYLFYLACVFESTISFHVLNMAKDNLVMAFNFHFLFNMSIHLFAIEPIDNEENIIPLVILIILEFIVGAILTYTEHLRKKKIKLETKEEN